MPARRVPPATELSGDAMLMLGEMRGQLRELIHTSNNTAQAVSAMGVRLAALEAESHQRKGANSLMALILKSPALGWLTGAVLAAWAFLSGRHP